jgi:hypothetical protein
MKPRNVLKGVKSPTVGDWVIEYFVSQEFGWFPSRYHNRSKPTHFDDCVALLQTFQESENLTKYRLRNIKTDEVIVASVVVFQ